jgi:hypothetical protein
MVFEGTMFGWLLVSVRVGPPARERPLRSTCPNVLSPPVIGLRPEIKKSPSVGNATAGGGSGGIMVSHLCPARPFVISSGGIESLNQKPVTSTN